MKIPYFCNIAVTAFLTLFYACSNVPEGGAEIVGKLTGFASDDSITVYLMHYDGISGRSIKTDNLRNGSFSFRLDSLSGDKHYSIDLMRIREDSYDILCLGPEIYLEPGAQVKIKGDGRYLYTADISSPVEDQKLGSIHGDEERRGCDGQHQQKAHRAAAGIDGNRAFRGIYPLTPQHNRFNALIRVRRIS